MLKCILSFKSETSSRDNKQRLRSLFLTKNFKHFKEKHGKTLPAILNGYSAHFIAWLNHNVEMQRQ
jgi:hypothetical protein